MSFLSVATADGRQLDASRAKISIPRTGNWCADVVLPSDSAPSGAISLTFGDDAQFKLSGFVRRSGAAYGVTPVRMVGGGGGLAGIAVAKSFQSSSAQVILQDALGAAGEQLSAVSDNPTISTQLPGWTRLAAPYFEDLQAMAAYLGVPWRTLNDGSIWLGPETWPTSKVSGYTVKVWKPEELYAVMSSPTDCSIWPGTVWEGLNVDNIEHRFTADSLLTRVIFQDPNLPA